MPNSMYRSAYRMRRHLRWRFGVRPRDPDLVAHVERIQLLIDAARRGDRDTETVLLAAIGHDLGEIGYYTTCCLLAERTLRACGMSSPLAGGRRSQDWLVLEVEGVDRAQSPEESRTTAVMQFLTSYANGDLATVTQAWRSMATHPDPGHFTAFLARFVAICANLIANPSRNGLAIGPG